MLGLNEASGGAQERLAELEEKQVRLQQWFDKTGYEGLLLRRHENLHWVTAGQFEARVVIPSETGVAALLLLRDGRRFCLAPDDEAGRLVAEELAGLDYEVIARPWHAMDFAAEAKVLAGVRLASDTVLGDLPVVELNPLRAPLHQAEMSRFRALGVATAAAVSVVLLTLQPGVSEYEMEARMAESLLREGILPSVLLMAVDERILHYKHAVARGAKLERFGMLNLCTRKWGLAVSITRFVHFGALPAELAKGFAVTAQVNAALQHGTREGATSGELFRLIAEQYAAAGFPGEEHLHHQGGACGYLEREWVARPNGAETVRTPQAFAWNPSCRGGKVEDTVLALRGSVEVLTRTPELPEVLTEFGGTLYVSAGVLVHG